jgi:hypothetical protein
MKDIERMKLYHHPDRIYNELKAIGHEKGKLCVHDLSEFDQYHYRGTAAVDEAINILNIDSSHRILDIGSGIGASPILG